MPSKQINDWISAPYKRIASESCCYHNPLAHIRLNNQFRPSMQESKSSSLTHITVPSFTSHCDTEQALHSLALRRRTVTHKTANHLAWLRERALQSLHVAAASSTRPARETCACCGRQNEPSFISQWSAFPGSKSKRVQTLVLREFKTATCERICWTFINTIPLAIPAPICPHKRLNCWIK